GGAEGQGGGAGKFTRGGAEAFPFKQDHARGGGSAVDDGLRTFEHGHVVGMVGGDVGRGRVHAVTAAAENAVASAENIEARSSHAAQERFAAAAALAGEGKTGNGAQDFGAVLSGNRLGRRVRIGGHAERAFAGPGGDDDGLEADDIVRAARRGGGKGGGT